MPVLFRRVSIFFRCMLKILYSIPERFLHRHAWQIESISQTGRLAECFSTSMICGTMHGGQGDHTETGDSVDSSDAPVIRSGLNQLELLTGIRMMIRILLYEDNYWQQWFSSHPICARPSRTVVRILSQYCHIVILNIILFAKCDPRQTTQTLTKFSTIASNRLLFVLATLEKDFLDRCDVNQTTRTC